MEAMGAMLVLSGMSSIQHLGTLGLMPALHQAGMCVYTFVLATCMYACI